MFNSRKITDLTKNHHHRRDCLSAPNNYFWISWDDDMSDPILNNLENIRKRNTDRPERIGLGAKVPLLFQNVIKLSEFHSVCDEQATSFPAVFAPHPLL